MLLWLSSVINENPSSVQYAMKINTVNNNNKCMFDALFLTSFMTK